MAKSFWVFAGKNYYPNGGFRDLKTKCYSARGALTTVKKLASKELLDWYQIVNMRDGEVVVEGEFIWKDSEYTKFYHKSKVKAKTLKLIAAAREG